MVSPRPIPSKSYKCGKPMSGTPTIPIFISEWSVYYWIYHIEKKHLNPLNSSIPIDFGDTVDGCEILHQLIGGKHPIIYNRVSTCFNHPFGAAGFLPSTVSSCRLNPPNLSVGHGRSRAESRLANAWLVGAPAAGDEDISTWTGAAGAAGAAFQSMNWSKNMGYHMISWGINQLILYTVMISND